MTPGESRRQADVHPLHDDRQRQALEHQLYVERPGRIVLMGVVADRPRPGGEGAPTAPAPESPLPADRSVSADVRVTAVRAFRRVRRLSGVGFGGFGEKRPLHFPPFGTDGRGDEVPYRDHGEQMANHDRGRKAFGRIISEKFRFSAMCCRNPAGSHYKSSEEPFLFVSKGV